MTQDRINQINKRLQNTKEIKNYSISGRYTANAALKYYIEDIDELLKEIERLKDNSCGFLVVEGEKIMPRDYIAARDYLRIDDRIMDKLREENQRLKALIQNGQSAIDTNQRLVKEIERLQAENEDLQKYKRYSESISKLPDCNTCMIQKECIDCPKWGDFTRINCPKHRSVKVIKVRSKI